MDFHVPGQSLCDLVTAATATATAAAVRAGETTATDFVASALDAIGDDPLNAFTELDHDGALKRAAMVDRLVESGRDPGPMAGVPVALKDLIDHEGHVTTAGSSFFRHRPRRNATVVQQLEAAGAVIVGRTGLHEFAFGFSSENAHFGPVLNPWNRQNSPGGSSGGSGAAVGAGWVPVAIGTDTGGSVRVPAALCGVLGLKVTHGAIPNKGVFPLAPSLDTVGPLARTVDDLRLALGVLEVADPDDPWSRRRPAQPDRTVRTIGVPRPWIRSAPLASDVEAAFDDALGWLRTAGYTVVELADDHFVPSEMIDFMAYGEIAQIHRAWWTEHPERYGHEVAERFEAVYRVTLDEFMTARHWRAGLQERARRLFDGVDVLVTPATCVTAKPIGAATVPTAQGDTGYRKALAWFTALVNHLSVPALTAPLAADGAPAPALQVIGPEWGEHRLLSAADTFIERGILGVAEPAPSA